MTADCQATVGYRHYVKLLRCKIGITRSSGRHGRAMTQNRILVKTRVSRYPTGQSSLSRERIRRDARLIFFNRFLEFRQIARPFSREKTFIDNDRHGAALRRKIVSKRTSVARAIKPDPFVGYMLHTHTHIYFFRACVYSACFRFARHPRPDPASRCICR